MNDTNIVIRTTGSCVVHVRSAEGTVYPTIMVGDGKDQFVRADCMGGFGIVSFGERIVVIGEKKSFYETIGNDLNTQVNSFMAMASALKGQSAFGSIGNQVGRLWNIFHGFVAKVVVVSIVCLVILAFVPPIPATILTATIIWVMMSGMVGAARKFRPVPPDLASIVLPTKMKYKEMKDQVTIFGSETVLQNSTYCCSADVQMEWPSCHLSKIAQFLHTKTYNKCVKAASHNNEYCGEKMSYLANCYDRTHGS